MKYFKTRKKYVPKNSSHFHFTTGEVWGVTPPLMRDFFPNNQLRSMITIDDVMQNMKFVVALAIAAVMAENAQSADDKARAKKNVYGLGYGYGAYGYPASYGAAYGSYGYPAYSSYAAPAVVAAPAVTAYSAPAVTAYSAAPAVAAYSAPAVAAYSAPAYSAYSAYPYYKSAYAGYGYGSAYGAAYGAYPYSAYPYAY